MVEKGFPVKKDFRDRFFLDTGDGHTLNVVEYGNQQGVPVLYLHGGPGAGHNPNWQKYFDPDFYRMIFFDQRGCGESTPRASTTNNTISKLVDDIERIRRRLGIENWVVGGRSFGSTLALEYAIKHGERVIHLVPTSIFFGDKDGAAHIGEANGAEPFDQRYFDAYQNFVPPDKQHDGLIAYYNQIMTEGTEEQKREAAKLFMMWDCSIGAGNLEEALPSVCAVEKNPDDEIPITTLFMHYSLQEFFSRSADCILRNNSLNNVPMTIIHGEKDRITPVENAHRLANNFAHATLIICPNAGHNGMHPEMVSSSAKAFNKIRESIRAIG